jgi:hypothetical protein
MMLDMLMAWRWQGESTWGPPRMMTAMMLDRNVLPPPATFEGGDE